MKYKILLYLTAALLLACALLASGQAVSLGQVTPRPANVVTTTGVCRLDADTRLLAGEGVNASTVRFMQDYLSKCYGTKLKVKPARKAIRLTLADQAAGAPEAYRLQLDTTGVVISSATQAGLFYGVVSLLQLLPAERHQPWSIHCGTITDQPRLAYRGLHLDVSRHFFPAAYIKRYLDLMAMHKLNVFHWHLTDNEGWRLPIKAFPLLTSKGGCMASAAKAGKTPRLESLIDGGSDGCYTIKEIRDIVRYAAERFITIVPEIDMPGHSQAALYAYPQYAAGLQADTADVFRPDEASYHFFTKILDEVCILFPGKYIHIGGDEVDFKKWERDTAVVKLAAAKGLTMKALENDFINRISRYLAAKGREAIGWDELMEAPLDSTVIIMGWRLSGFAAKAAQQGHEVIQTPYDYTYFDFAQHQREDSVTVKMYLPLSKVYAFRPLVSAHLLGAQANVWTENINNTSKLEYMLLPRLAALSEVLWTVPERRSWLDFKARLMPLESHYQLWGFNYCKDDE